MAHFCSHLASLNPAPILQALYFFIFLIFHIGCTNKHIVYLSPCVSVVQCVISPVVWRLWVWLTSVSWCGWCVWQRGGRVHTGLDQQGMGRGSVSDRTGSAFLSFLSSAIGSLVSHSPAAYRELVDICTQVHTLSLSPSQPSFLSPLLMFLTSLSLLCSSSFSPFSSFNHPVFCLIMLSHLHVLPLRISWQQLQGWTSALSPIRSRGWGKAPPSRGRHRSRENWLRLPSWSHRV